ncbi:divergent Flap endonuclease [Salmon gill poxvirus]|nr:divergent Flap endonuclease [Salmon gill poxvirus]
MGISKLRGVLDHARIGPGILDPEYVNNGKYSKIVLDMSIFIWAYVKEDLDPTDLLNKLNDLKSVYSEIICVFDGRAPVQKVKEQLQRRLYNDKKNKRFGTAIPKFDFFDDKYRIFLSKLSKRLSKDDYIVLTPSIDGEADHKIYQYLTIDEDSPTIIVSNDWDLFVRGVCFCLRNKKADILYSCPAGLYDPKQITCPIKWLQSVMILGSDYYPGIGNYRMFKHLFDRLDNENIWLEIFPDRININRDTLRKWLIANIEAFDTVQNYMERNFVNVVDDDDMITESNFENTFSSDEICTDFCLFCEESTDVQLHSQDLYESWIDMLNWTLTHYFMKPKTFPVVYPYGYGPDISGMIMHLQLPYNNTHKLHNIKNKEYVTKKIWKKARENKYRFTYRFCPRRPVYYRSQLSVHFFYS